MLQLVDGQRQGGEGEGRAPAAIEALGLDVVLGGCHVLRDVSFEVPEGRTTVLLGPSGVGKTTCLRQLVGLSRPIRGDVRVDGRSRLRLSAAERMDLQTRFGVVFQGSGLHGSALFESMTVYDNVGFQLRATQNPGLAANQLRSRPDPLDAESDARVREALDEVGMSGHIETMPAELSAGMRRRVALARALVSDPDFLVVDGLDAGLDGVRLMLLADMIAERQRRTGATYLIATHDIEVAEALADHIVVLWGGSVIAEGPAVEVLASDRAEVRQLLDGERSGPLRMADAAPVSASDIPLEESVIDEVVFSAIDMLPMPSLRLIFGLTIAAAIGLALVLSLIVY